MQLIIELCGAPIGRCFAAPKGNEVTDQNSASGRAPEDALENSRELVGDRALAVQDFADEEEGYHKTLRPVRSR